MFIDKKEAAKRIKNSRDVLSRINPKNVPASPSADSSNGNANGSHPVEESVTDTPEEFAAKFLDDVMGVTRPVGKNYGPKMHTVERANLGLTGMLLGGPRAGALMGRGPDSSQELRHGYVSQEKMQKGVQDAPLIDELTTQKKMVRDLAFSRLGTALDLITQDKLEKVTDVTKLSRVSRDLATVVDKTLPKEAAVNQGVHFHIWKPEMREESTYEIINVNAPK